MERPVEAPRAQGHTVAHVFTGSETCMSPCHTEKPRKWQALAFSCWGQAPEIFYCTVTETQLQVSHLAGRQRWLRENGPRLSPLGSSSLDSSDNESV